MAKNEFYLGYIRERAEGYQFRQRQGREEEGRNRLIAGWAAVFASIGSRSRIGSYESRELRDFDCDSSSLRAAAFRLRCIHESSRGPRC
jgi:hypothetical protein